MTVGLLVVLACAGAGRSAAPVPRGVPRSVPAAEERLVRLGLSEVSCEGGALGDELSLVCAASLRGASVTVEAVTTGMPLPPPSSGVGQLVDDLWVTVQVTGDDAAAAELLRGFAGVPGRR